MNNVIEKVRDFLAKYNINDSNKTFIVAFSGGYDSMCLLHVLHSICANKIVAIHLNHNWRGEESVLEEKRCEDFCRNIGVEFYSETLPGTVPCNETAARDARYKFFEKCSEKFHSDVIFTAHNANDNAETLIYRIIKGTAIDGLAGIAPVRDLFYRPLLKVLRKDIEAYCNINNLTPNSDSSNSNTKYNRNFIRHEILPKFEKINTDTISAINSLSELARDDSEYLDNIAKSIGTYTLRFKDAANTIKRRYIKNLLIENKLDYDRAKIELIQAFIDENADSKAGKVMSLSEDLQLFVNIGTIKVIQKPKAKLENIIDINNQGFYDFGNKVFLIMACNDLPDEFPPDSRNFAYIQIDKIDFQLRTRRNGDTFAPIGLNGKHQKLKKYLNEKKVPQHQKDSLVFLCDDKEVLWAPGLGLSDKIKVRTKVTHIIKLYERVSDEKC